MLVSKDAHTPLSFLPRLEETDLGIKHVKKALLDDDYHVSTSENFKFEKKSTQAQ